jgi:2-dehydro-3-deoxyphosphogluconate aldolase/(4S)-4-hydroxy-2-oxoglutarate aldolase
VKDLDAVLAHHRIVPVLTVAGADHGAQLGQALRAGGLPLAEVTMRAAGALEALEAMAASGQVLVGAGTVLTADQAERAVAAGARFVVSPGFDATVVRRCRELGVPVLPGVATPSDVMNALKAEVRTVKLFPADLLGGPAAVRALSGPFPGIRFVPTGGVRADTVASYLSSPAVLAVGGSWMAPPELVVHGAWDEISRRVQEAVRVIEESTKETA